MASIYFGLHLQAAPRMAKKKRSRWSPRFRAVPVRRVLCGENPDVQTVRAIALCHGAARREWHTALGERLHSMYERRGDKDYPRGTNWGGEAST